MSLHAVEQVLWNVNFKPEVMARFQSEPERVLDDYRLDEQERALVANMDVRALADRGASQMLLMMAFQTLHGGMAAMPEYMRKMNSPQASP